MISIIIPTYNEAANIQNLLEYLQKFCGVGCEIIVSDGGSTDATLQLAEKAGARAILSPRKGRGAQLHFGASQASYPILYFLHADSWPPAGFGKAIEQKLQEGYQSGCFRLQFDSSHWFLKTNAWFTRFNVNAVRFGDQSLFCTADVYSRSGGFDTNLYIMEDQEIIHRLKKAGKFCVIKDYVTTSARKYLDNGVYRLQWIFFLIWCKYYLGFSQQKLLKTYNRHIRKSKL